MGAFQDWKRECEIIEQEMNRLLAEGIPKSEADRQVRKIQFRSLIERREAAARNLLPRAPKRPELSER
jgi:hypothetical protein